MFALPASLSRGLSVLLDVLALTLVYGRQSTAAEPPPASVHRMVIQEGVNRSVHYIASGNLSISDRLAVWVGNEKYVGAIKDDRPGWIVLQTDKAEVTVRKSEITRAEVPPKP